MIWDANIYEEETISSHNTINTIKPSTPAHDLFVVKSMVSHK
jgi:hypothetical protein